MTEVYTKLLERSAILILYKVCFASVGILMSAACLFMDVMISYSFSRAIISCIGVDRGDTYNVASCDDANSNYLLSEF
jgi:hypothetical protein